MTLYQKGEYRAFEVLFERHSGRVHGYLRSRMADLAEVDDLIQQTFLRLHQSRNRYDSSLPFLPWLFTIVRNLQVDFLRKKKPIPVELEKFQLADESSNNSAEAEEAVLLGNAMQGLTPAQRDLITLRFQEGLSFEQISKKLGTTSSTARKQVSRLLGRLRGSLTEKKTGKGNRS